MAIKHYNLSDKSLAILHQIKEPTQILREAEKAWKRKLEREKQVKDNKMMKRGGIK